VLRPPAGPFHAQVSVAAQGLQTQVCEDLLYDWLLQDGGDDLQLAAAFGQCSRSSANRLSSQAQLSRTGL
jgi:hypothetical protein